LPLATTALPREDFVVSDVAIAMPETTVDAKVRYLNPEWRQRADSPRIGSRESRRAATSFRDVPVHDARPGLAGGDIDLDHAGFTLTRHRSTCPDFRDEATVRASYFPEMTALIRRVTGAGHAFVRSHLVRTETPIDFNDGYARFVHCDYNIRRLEEIALGVLVAQGVEPRANWTYAMYNTWQPFDHPVQKNPLAMIDARSLPFEDVIDYYYTGRGIESMTAAPVYNRAHRWCYVPGMQTDEVLVIKQLDPRPGRSVYCPHTSFDLPGSDGLLPRRSIETRLLAVFEDAD
jgi:hypothetical protein